MLKRTEVKNLDCQEFLECWDCYQASFPILEQRPLKDYKGVLNDSRFVCYHFSDAKGFVGFIMLWHFKALCYGEHFAIHPQRRNEGLGCLIMQELLAASPSALILEIEPPIDALTQRRAAFYQRLGFQSLPYAHKQTAYCVGNGEIDLKLLSYPHAVEAEKVQEFQQELRAAIIRYRES